MRNILMRWSQALLIGFSLAGAAGVQAQSCVPGNWVSPPNTLWDSGNGSFPVQAESARFQIRWPKDKALLTPAQAQAALNELESAMNWFTGPIVKWPEPYCDSDVKYKVQIFSNEGYPVRGSGAGERAQAMWVNPWAVILLGRGETSSIIHELTHTMQYHSKGMRDTLLGGWLWESHAEFMAHQYPGNPDKTGCAIMSAWMPHLNFGSSRLRYCNWQFWDFLKDKYGFSAVNDIFLKSAGQAGQDPLAVLMRNQGWSPALLGDEFGQFAMRNVTWDYVDSQDSYNRGAAFRKAFGLVSDLGQVADFSIAKRLRVARMEAFDVTRRRFVVSKYFAPQRYGYNLVKLVPDAGSTSITVNFNGLVQKSIAAGAEVGSGSFEPGMAPTWKAFAMPTNPASNWRWGVVAIGQNGNPRYSAMQRGATASMTFPLQTGDQGVYLVVAATPDEYHSIFWDQKYHSIYRYPYAVELAGAMPDGFQAGYQSNVANGFPAGTRHPNGGGWVAKGAVVEPTAYVGPNAAVLGGRVLGSARIEDYAIVWNGTVQDKAVVGGLTQLHPNVTVADSASVRSVMGGDLPFGSGSVINGTSVLFGDLAVQMGTTPVSKGAFSGILNPSLATRADAGANRTSAPVEVTETNLLPLSGATECAQEGLTCAIPAGHTATVWYGAGLRFNVRSGLTGSVTCNSASFGGDPAVGVWKSCTYAVTAANATPPAQAASCAQDGQTCALPAGHTATVWYGAGSRFSVRTGLAGNVDCSTATFGDSKTAVGGSCTFVVTAPPLTPPAQAVTCAQETQPCVLPVGHTATVWYGAGTRFAARTSQSGSVACNATTFGDPAVGSWKTCAFVVTAPPTTPPAQAVSCAQDGQTCALPAGHTATVWYGAGSSFSVRTGMTGSVACSAANFGDLAATAGKSCSYAVTATPPAPPAQAVSCAQEGQACALPAGSSYTVWYGADTRYTARAGVSGRITCGVAGFGGDPAIGAWKSCSYVRN